MAATVEEDIWGGEDDDDFYLSVNLDEGKVSNSNGDNGKVVLTLHTPQPSTSRLSTMVMSEASLGTRLSDLVETACKKQRQLNGSTPVQVQANKTKIRVYRRKGSKVAPLKRFKYGRLFVTDITTQFWCELQMVFKYEPPPVMKHVEIIPKAEVVTGCTLHMVRELQVEKRVVIKVESSEDRFALKVLSLLDGVLSMLKFGKTMRREIHIFGTPFNMGVFVNGIIDEIRCHPQTLDLEIVEFKTRMTDCMPPEAQILTHKIQVMLYKRLFDEMINGTFNKDAVAANFWLNLDKPFGADLMAQTMHKDANTLSKLLDLLVETMRGVPFISSLMLEYAFQKDGSTIGYSEVEYDEEWLREKLVHSLSYWKGEREPRGVAIEECWKCIRCDYADACKWKTALLKKHKLKSIEDIRPPEDRPPTQEEKIDPWNSSLGSVASTPSANENNVDVNADVGIVPLTPKEQNLNVDADVGIMPLALEEQNLNVDADNGFVSVVPEEQNLNVDADVGIVPLAPYEENLDGSIILFPVEVTNEILTE